MLPFFPGALPADLNDPRLKMLAHLLAECATIQNAATFLASGDDWDLLAVYYETIDHAGHGFMEYYPPAMSHVSAADAAAFAYVVKGVYRFHDMLLSQLLAVAGPETTVIILSDHGFYSDALRPPVARHTTDPSEKFGAEMNPVAWHRQQGIFVAAGPRHPADELIHGATLLDIAPTVLTLLGLAVPDDMDGRALLKILDEPPAEPARIASYEPPHPLDGVHRDLSAEETDPWAARQALEQLAALGYIELPDADNPTKAATMALRERKWNLAQVYLNSSRTARAEELLRELLAEQENPSMRCCLALCLLGLGRPEEAAETVTPLLDREGSTPMARLIMGRAKLRLKDPTEALRWLEPLRVDEERLPRLSLALGLTYLRCGLLTQAEAAFRPGLGARRG